MIIQISDDSVKPQQVAKERCPYLKPLYMLNNYLNRGKDYPQLKEDMDYIHRKVPYLVTVALSLTSLYVTSASS
jgi:hypothetical protein